MNQIVYIDLFFLINFIMDLVILALAGHIAGEKTSLGRLLLASLPGALFSSVALFFSWEGIALFFLGFVIFLPMVWIAYGKISRRRQFFLTLFSYLTSFVFGGVFDMLSYYFHLSSGAPLFGLLLAAVFFLLGAWSLWGKGLKRKMESAVISLSVFHRGREEQLFGLVDSGSFLKEPSTGAPVILMKAEYATSLLSPQELLRIRLGEGEGVVSVPLKTASGTGCLFGFFPQSVRIHRLSKKRKKEREECVLIALDFSGGAFAGCPCLVPLSMV